MNHKEVAKRVMLAVGKENILAAAHCATRLRLVVKDVKAINQDALDNDQDLKGTFNANGQYQIIVGPGDVNTVYKELTKLTGVSEATKDDLKKMVEEQKTNPVMALIKILSDIFVPLLPALVAGGLLMALNNLLTGEGIFAAKSVVEMFPQWEGFAQIVNMMASAPFTFLPILIGYSATKRFGGNGYLGAAAGMMLVMPDLINGYGVQAAMADGSMTYWNVFGLKIAQAGYQGQVLPVIGVAFVLANLEKFFHKKINDAIDFTFTPMLSIIITGFLTFTIIGPVLRTASDALTSGFMWGYETLGALGMGIFGLLYSAIVLTGLHQSFPAIETSLLADVATTGGSFLLPVAAAANIAQGAATFAVFFITKNKKQKALASSAGVSAMLGITEPAIFGVNLKLKFPFFIGLIASGISSAIFGLLHVLSVSMGPAGIIGFITIRPQSIPGFFVGAVLSFVLAFVGTYVYGKRVMVESDEPKYELEAELINATPTLVGVKDEELGAPVAGTLVNLKDVNDPVFSSEAMGQGIAISPSEGIIVSPADGVVTVSYETGHAYGLKTENGAEILIHVGIDTVSMNGEGFERIVNQGQVVKKGDKLGRFDINKIRDAGLDATTMFVVTNSLSYAQVETICDSRDVNTSDNLLALTQPVEK
ncbi:sucrose-specific PTS transporter subunit IIBC [Enterococcus faecium]|uniref:sucrose-specific PTS transporter subunit IIBC n=1 Tax=Enterococcus faecium TaxID=1352 RepID=UPI0032E8CFB1